MNKDYRLDTIFFSYIVQDKKKSMSERDTVAEKCEIVKVLDGKLK